MARSIHVPVLLHEVVSACVHDGIHSTARGTTPFWYADCTLGGAGHALAIADAYQKATGNKLSLIGFDRDGEAISRAKELLIPHTQSCILVNDNYRNIDKILDTHHIPAVDCILLDLGISSDELDVSGRGFTFLKDEPLYMTMGDPVSYPFTAQTIVNEWDEDDIANVIYGYGEDRYARRIARAIVAYRTKKKIESTTELAEIVKGAMPRRAGFAQNFSHKKTIHPATRTFQALRIAVNDELGALKEGLAKGYAKLAPKGRMVVISFHSLEDRIVKEFFRQQVDGYILTKKPITASEVECSQNPRSRSAKLRIIEKLSI